MPVLSLHISPLHNPERYAALGAALTRITADLLHKQPGVTSVLIHDMPAAQFLVGSHSSPLPLACLDIRITEGTNTPEEKSRFIAAAFAELQRQLGSPGQALHEASYVIVSEVPAGNWGYGGLTQLHRRMQPPARVSSLEMIK
jgi:4-oxalocrotonate tautomerase